MSIVNDSATLCQIASIIAGFGASLLTFRIQRHLQQLPLEGEEHSWLPVADWLLMSATALALLGVVVPLLAIDFGTQLRFPRGACAASSVLLVGYIFAIQAHYRLILGGKKRYPKQPSRRETPWAEWMFSIVALVSAVAVFFLAFFQDGR